MLLALRPNQLRRDDVGLVRLRGVVVGAEATRLDMVGMALEDFVERWPGLRAGRLLLE